MNEILEKQTMRKVMWRLMPLIVIMYFMAYIDRTNVSFAALEMNKDLGLTATAFGWGAGVFFFGYFLLEVPSNIILSKVGARRWLARILFTWGLISGLTAFATGPISFCILRFMLGLAEAGFFPGVILYLTFWFPKAYRARATAFFYIAVPLSNALGSVISGALLDMHGLGGLAGWQWVFIVEAVPSVLLTFVVLRYLTDRPEQADWLKPDQKQWLVNRLADEKKTEFSPSLSLLKTLCNPLIVGFCLIYFAMMIASYGNLFFLPALIKSLGVSNFQTGLLAALPNVFAVVGIILFGISSDRNGERRLHILVACLMAGVGLIASGWFAGSYWSVVAMSVALVGIYGAKPCFWPMMSSSFGGMMAVAGIAMVNAVGNLGGSVGPAVAGMLKDATGSYQAGLYFLGSCALVAGLGTLWISRTRTPIHNPETASDSVGQGT